MTRGCHLAVALALALGLLAVSRPGAAAAPPGEHRFVALGHVEGDEERLKQALSESRDKNVRFVAAIGIKGMREPCSDKLYLRRRALFDDALRPLILTPAGSDWTECRNSLGRSDAIERLIRIRELFFSEARSLGQHTLELTRLSGSAKFRSYAENAHWKVDGVLYATINVPSNNNHYLRAAGRNSEYEDRLVANRAWLHRLFMLAQREHTAALVLFSDANLALAPGARAAADDGFAAVRRQLRQGTHRFKGTVLLVDAARPAKGPPVIEWQGNVGHLSLGTSAAQVLVEPGSPTRFTLAGPEPKGR
jgi:hypothetical protein